MAAEIIDLGLVRTVRRCLNKMLEARGLNYFLRADAKRPFHLNPSKVELVVRAAVRLRPEHLGTPSAPALEYCRQEVRRALIQQVARLMLGVGL